MEYIQTIRELMELITCSQVFYMQKINKKINLSEKLFWITCSVSGMCIPSQLLEKIYQKVITSIVNIFLNITLWSI